MAMRLAYAIHFVADMDRAVAFYRDTIGLPLQLSSPEEWTEFATGSSTASRSSSSSIPTARASA